jgi:hemolysin-activating ACP:hemolysin acyltransferase
LDRAASGAHDMQGLPLTNPTAQVSPAARGAEGLRAVRLGNGHQALGMAVAFLMADPAFQGLRFGHWARVLAGQIRRGHFLFVMDGNNVVGFAGWALTSRENAEEWLAGRGELSYQDSLAGEFVILNAWKATTPAANRLLIDAFRRLFRSKQALYYKRFYADGRMRPARLRVNEFVRLHIGEHA